MTGGRLYVAGPANVLGRFCATWTRVQARERERVPSLPPRNVPALSLTQDGAPPQSLDTVSVCGLAAGFCHSAIITTEGELWCWGANEQGCCGQPLATKFVFRPELIRAIYERPRNLALGKPARQSSCYGGLDAHLGVDGNNDGSNPQYCMSTQQDPQAWWEVDLGEFAVIDTVKIWNRTDEPPDQSMERDKFSKRLFPSWCMVAQRA